MKTEILKPTEENIKKSAKIVNDGGLVAMPTETVYGLAANAFDEKAVKSIFVAKGRPSDNPLIVHIADMKQLYEIVEEVPEIALKLAERFWPGPLTMVFKSNDIVPKCVTAGMDTVAVRMPSNEIARKLITYSKPIAAPSANTSGAPSPTTAQFVYDDLNGKIPCILDGGECQFGVESTVVSVLDSKLRLLRPGGISLEELKEIDNEIEVDPSVLQNVVLEKVSSPGMKHKHYSPKAKVYLVKASSDEFVDFVNRRKRKNVFVLCFDEDIGDLKLPYESLGKQSDYLSQSHKLFSLLRIFDQKGAETVFAHCPDTVGIGLAVYNRLLRSSAFNVIELNGVKVIGVTGQSGSGKSVVASFLKDFGGEIIDADKIAHNVLNNSDVIEKIKNNFGEDVVKENVVDRKSLGSIVFGSEEKLNLLNSITHPQIIEDIKKKINCCKLKKSSFIVLDAPLLFECGLDNFCDYSLAVLTDFDLKIARIVERDNISVQLAKERLKSQLDNDFYESLANNVIYNNSDINNLENKVKGMLDLWQISHRQ